MRNFGATILVLVLSIGGAAAQDRTIRVVGSGEVTAPPDLATLTTGAEAQAETAAAALDDLAEILLATLAALEAAGVADIDVQTGSLSLVPVYAERGTGPDSGPPAIVGYRAGSDLRVQVREVTELGAIIDAAVAAGANRLRGVSFALSDPEPALDRARADAVRAATAKAELYAEAAAVGLGEVLLIREPEAARPVPLTARAEAAADMPIATGTVALKARVEGTFAID